MNNLTKFSLLILFLLAFFIWANIARSPSDSTVHLYFLDVGQGDSILIEKGSVQLLIDGGPDDAVATELGKLMPPTDKRIETVILTHPHADHLTGLVKVLAGYEVGQVYTSGINYDSATNKAFLLEISTKKIATKVPEIGERVTIFPDGEIQFLWPGTQYQGKTIENLNNSSIVTRFCYVAACVLLPGDLEVDGQSDLFANAIKEGLNLQSDLLKLPHHGSANGTNLLLLTTVLPKTVVISVGGGNKFGHPHESVLQLLESRHYSALRTDTNHNLQFTLTPQSVLQK